MQIADGGGGGLAPMDTSAWDTIGKSMADFAGGAAAGKIAVNETGGQALLTAIKNLVEWIDGQGFELEYLGQEPALGSSKGAEVMKPYVASVATDGQGFIPMLKKFRDSLAQAEQGINDAMKNYREMDQGGSARLR